jgi:F420-0:gamma-glutamyl ligase
MKFIPVRTRKIVPPRDDIYSVLSESLPRLRERDVLFVTSKVLAIHQGRCVKIAPSVSKESLIKREAERYALSGLRTWKDLYVTIKGHTLIANAGIDESNGNGYYVLWPRRPSLFAKEIRTFLKRKFVTDSHILPMRRGVVGISIGFHGMNPLYDYSEVPDIFGRPLKHTTKNVVDALSAMAVFLMGEASEQTPMLVLRGAKFISFTGKGMHRKSVVAPKDDLFAPLWAAFR